MTPCGPSSLNIYGPRHEFKVAVTDTMTNTAEMIVLKALWWTSVEDVMSKGRPPTLRQPSVTFRVDMPCPQPVPQKVP